MKNFYDIWMIQLSAEHLVLMTELLGGLGWRLTIPLCDFYSEIALRLLASYLAHYSEATRTEDALQII